MRKGRTVTGPVPDWVVLLRQERRAINQPSLRELSNWTNIPHTTIGTWFSGKVIPGRADLEILMRAMEVDAKTRDRIAELIQQDRAERAYHSTFPVRLDQPASRDGGFHELTAAINRLTDKIDEFLQDAWPDHH